MSAAPQLNPFSRKAGGARMARRRRTEWAFKYAGVLAIAIAAAALAFLLATILRSGLSALATYEFEAEIDLPAAPNADPDAAAIRALDFSAPLRQALYSQFPEASDRSARQELRSLFSELNAAALMNQAIDDPSLLGQSMTYRWPVRDTVESYLKGVLTGREIRQREASLSVVWDAARETAEFSATSDAFAQSLRTVRLRMEGEAAARQREADRLEELGARFERDLAELGDSENAAPARAEIERRIADAERGQRAAARQAEELLLSARAEGAALALDEASPSVLLKAGDQVWRLDRLSDNRASGRLIAGTVPENGRLTADGFSIIELSLPESMRARKINDRQAAWIEIMLDRDVIQRAGNWRFFTNASSRAPEMAGIWGGVIGSVLIMLVTMGLAIPVGVASAIYLEEFAPKNAFTRFIEANIANLAAVPSIVFGLLGLAVFHHLVGLPRSVPVLGGLVLALMSLPTIIIATRASLKAVPPSIRDGALALGASHTQAVFHHVAPLAAPGILTGSIIALAQAMGETAPLLLIGMVVFLADPPTLFQSGFPYVDPGAFMRPAAPLPVEIYQWVSYSEAAYRARTFAAIIVLLVVVFAMNLVAIILRNRYEKTW